MPLGSQRLFPRLGELRKRHPLLHIDIDTAPHLEDRVGDTLDAAIILSRGPASGLHAALGPSIGGCCYEIEREIADGVLEVAQDASD